MTVPANSLRLACIATLLLAAGFTTAHADTVLEIMAEDDAAPWAQADGSGAANDIVRAAFAAAGVDVVLRTVAYARCKHMVVTGQIAGCFSMSADPAMTDKVVFAEQPLYRNYVQYFENPQHPLRATTDLDIQRGKVIGIVTDYEYPDSVTALAQRGVILEAAGSESANLKKLASGRIDATVVNLDDLKSANFLLRKAGVADAVAPLFHSADFGAYIGFSVKHRQGLWARDKFNEGFAKISSDGRLQEILEKWRAQRR